jgi:hypothetical protein
MLTDATVTAGIEQERGFLPDNYLMKMSFLPLDAP